MTNSGNGHATVAIDAPAKSNGSKTVFQPGNRAAVGHGRPKGSVNWQRELELAVRKVEKSRKKTFMVHAVDRAYDSDKVLPHVLDRLTPRLGDPGAQATPITVQILNYTSSVPTPL